MPRPALRTVLAALAASLALTLAFAGCGDSKPAYCDKQGELETAVGQLDQIEAPVTEPAATLTALREIESKAFAVTPEVRNEFPTEVQRFERSLRALVPIAKQVVAEPSVAAGARLLRRVELARASAVALEDAVQEGCE